MSDKMPDGFEARVREIVSELKINIITELSGDGCTDVRVQLYLGDTLISEEVDEVYIP